MPDPVVDAVDPLPLPRELVLTAVIPGDPKPWKRARDTGDGYQNPADYSRAKRYAATILRNAWSDPGRGLRRVTRPPLDEPLSVECVFFFARPKARPPVIPPAMWAIERGCPAVGRADLDNYIATVLDAGTDAGIWVDDTRAVDFAGSRKVYLPPGETGARTVVRVWRWVVPEVGP